ncbi:hypothetical protein Tco_0578923 [Tanacetum coccineum]
MAALVISISSDSTDKSVGSSIPRVILFGSIRIEVPVVPADLPIAPEVGAVVVASPGGVLELDTHSLSESGPSEGSQPPVPVAPMVSPILCSNDSESDTELPERYVSSPPHDAMIPTTPILPAPPTIVAPSIDIISPIDAPPRVKMGDPNITMEEYTWLEEEKAHRHGKVYNWETATYGRIWYDDDVYDLRSVETEFPAIVFNDKLTSEVAFSCETTVSPLNDNQIDFRISFDNPTMKITQ